MFDIVKNNLIEDKATSDRVILLCNQNDTPIHKTIYESYQNFILTYSGDVNELSNAAEVTEGVFNQMGVELGL